MIFQIKLIGTIYFDHILKFFIENQINQIKFFIILAVAYYAEARNEFAAPISESLHVRATQSFDKISQRWQTIGTTMSDFTGPRFELQTSRSEDEPIIAPPTGRFS